MSESELQANQHLFLNAFQFADDQTSRRLAYARMTDHLSPVLDLSLNDRSSDLAYYYYGQNVQDIGLNTTFLLAEQPLPPFPVLIGGTGMSEKQEDQFQKATETSGHVSPPVSTKNSSVNFPIDINSQWHDPPQSIWSHQDIQEVCLMRYFVEELAQWVSADSTISGSIQETTQLIVSGSLTRVMLPDILR